MYIYTYIRIGTDTNAHIYIIYILYILYIYMSVYVYKCVDYYRIVIKYHQLILYRQTIIQTYGYIAKNKTKKQTNNN